MRLFKYVSIETMTKIIKNKCLRFTQPCQLNDPFEMIPVYSNDITKLDITGWLSKEDIIEFNKYLFNVNYLGLSMSKCMDSILMWAHYGENHYGVMLEFNLDSNFFDTKNSEGLIYSVPYSTKRPTFVSNDIVIKASYNKVSGEERNEMCNCILSKAECWDYEEEVRFIKPVSCLEKDDGTRSLYDLDGSGLIKSLFKPNRNELKLEFPEIFVKKMENDTIKAVYFGLKTGEESINNIKKDLKEQGINPRYYQAKASQAEFKICYMEI